MLRFLHVITALESGARGYILKGIAGPTLIMTVRAIAAGDSYITPDLAARLLASPLLKSKPVNASGVSIPQLTVRENQYCAKSRSD